MKSTAPVDYTIADDGFRLKLIERFERKLIPEPNSGCWLWLGAFDPQGYGYFCHSGKVWRAIRMSVSLYHGWIDPKLHVDHLCRNTSCVNPDHLEPVTRSENARRGRSFSAEKTHCRNGHEFTVENTRIAVEGYRYCDICYKASKKRSKDRERLRLQMSHNALTGADVSGVTREAVT